MLEIFVVLVLRLVPHWVCDPTATDTSAVAWGSMWAAGCVVPTGTSDPTRYVASPRTVPTVAPTKVVGWLERPSHTREVTGSSPVRSTMVTSRNAGHRRVSDPLSGYPDYRLVQSETVVVGTMNTVASSHVPPSSMCVAACAHWSGVRSGQRRSASKYMSTYLGPSPSSE